MKFSIKDFFSKCDQIRSKLKKSLMENFIFCTVWDRKIFRIFSSYLWLNDIPQWNSLPQKIFYHRCPFEREIIFKEALFDRTY